MEQVVVEGVVVRMSDEAERSAGVLHFRCRGRARPRFWLLSAVLCFLDTQAKSTRSLGVKSQVRSVLLFSVFITSRYSVYPSPAASASLKSNQRLSLIHI